MQKKINKEDKILIILISILIIIDQIVKIFFLVSEKKFGLEDTWNLGIFEHTNSENNIAYILIGIFAIIMIIRYIKMDNTFIKTNTKIIMSFAIAGAISNVIDRLWYNGTVNYINIPNFSHINLAYIYFFVTWVGMAVILTKYSIKRLTEKKINDEAKKFDEKEFREFLKKKKEELSKKDMKKDK